jgi:2-polyprenyl-3-methyl-5-hydroxy-6-metoxy-1,4-benzoquinol methylase
VRVLTLTKYFYRDNENINFIDINPSNFYLPKLYKCILLLDVLEHVPDPLKLVINLQKHVDCKGYFVETFINDEDGTVSKSNLRSANELRKPTFNFLNDNFDLISGSIDESGGTRIWRKLK